MGTVTIYLPNEVEMFLMKKAVKQNLNVGQIAKEILQEYFEKSGKKE